MQVDFLDLKAQFGDIQKEVMEGIFEVLKSGEFVLGSAVSEFEQIFSDYVFNQAVQSPKENLQEAIGLRIKQRYDENHCVGVGNGTDALEIAIRALNLPPKSEIIIPANTYFACAEAVLNAGFEIVIADCEEDGLFIPKDEMINERTSAIIAVHLYGQILDLSVFEVFAKKYNLKLIEDCTHAHGGVDTQGRSFGSIGDVGCFSFYPAKNLGAYGDGGAIVSKDFEILNQARQIANHGQMFIDSAWQKNRHITLGRNSRLDSIQAKVLQIKLKSLEQHNAYRRRCAREYCEQLEAFSFLKLPLVFSQSVWHLFVIECTKMAQNRRDELVVFLQENGIECGIHYPCALSDIEILKNDHRVRIL